MNDKQYERSGGPINQMNKYFMTGIQEAPKTPLLKRILIWFKVKAWSIKRRLFGSHDDDE